MRLLLPLSLLSLIFVGAPVAADVAPAATVWTIKDGTVDGGCDLDGRKEAINKWHEESWELASYALAALRDYSRDAIVRRAVKTFFGLNPRSRGSTAPSVSATLDHLIGIVLRSFVCSWC